MKLDKTNTKLDFSSQGLMLVMGGHDCAEIDNVFADLVRDKFKNNLLDVLLYSSLDFDVLIEQDRLWLDKTPVVTRIVKSGNTIEIIDGYFDNKNFVPVKKYVFANITKEFEKEIKETKEKYQRSFEIGRRLTEQD